MDPSKRIPLLVAASVAGVAFGLVLVHSARASGDAHSASHRLIAGSAASVNGTASSPAYTAHVVGGSGAAVGIAVSQNTSIVAGNSTVDPPVRLFFDNFEGN